MSTVAVPMSRSTYLKLAPNEDSIGPEGFKDWCETKLEARAKLAVDLFSGAGGLSLGVEQAGWTIAASVDHYKAALETHRHNFGGMTLDWDLGDPEARDRFVAMFEGIEIDLVAGGPPCQPFSRAGRSKIRSLVLSGARPAVDPRKQMWQAFLDIALRLNPRAVLMENVPDMGLSDDFHVLRYMSETFQEHGYATSINLVDAWRFGVPQHRQRMILLARRDGLDFAWPDDDPKVLLRDVLSDLPNLNDDTGCREMPYQQDPENDFQREMRRGAGEILTEHMTRPVRHDDRIIFSMMKPDMLYSEIPADLRRYRADSFTDKYHRLDPDGLSRSITAHIAKDGYWYIHPEENRTLTVREAARIQTFPDRFRFAGTRSDAFRQIGNAVPPSLGRAAATALGCEAPEIGWQDVRQLQVSLVDWAREQAVGAMRVWFPGHDVTPLVALAMAAQSRLHLGDQRLASTIRPLLGKQVLSRTLLNRCIGLASSQRQMDLLANLERLLNVQVTVDDEFADEVRLRNAEKRLFLVLGGEDVLLRNQACFRVAARTLGTESDQRNKYSHGLLDVARLVGSGPKAPTRMAAIRLLGSQVCTARAPRCDACPLVAHCAYARGNETLDPTLGLDPNGHVE